MRLFRFSCSFPFPSSPTKGSNRREISASIPGYIPKRSSQFGKTYATECMDCFRDHFNELKTYKMENQVALSRGRLQPLRSEDDISEHMKVFANNQLAGRGMFVKIEFYFWLLCDLRRQGGVNEADVSKN